MLSFFRKAKPPAKPFNFSENRYPSRSTWPPKYDHLSDREQFKLERKFRRRAKLKWARPGWNKFLILAQWASIGTVLAYATLYMDWSGTLSGDMTEEGRREKGKREEENLPEVVRKIRRWYFGVADGIWEGSSSLSSRGHVDLMQQRLKEEQTESKTRSSSWSIPDAKHYIVLRHSTQMIPAVYRVKVFKFYKQQLTPTSAYIRTHKNSATSLA